MAVCSVSVVRAQVPGVALDVAFPATGGTPQLTGHLHRPEGSGPFPAVALLHGCGGISPTHHWWADRLRRWGYVALLVDSLGPRGQTNICDDYMVVNPLTRMRDAYAARAYLASQSFAAPALIAVIGWSHGGTATLYAVDDVYLSKLGADRFRAAIAFYPSCMTRLEQLNAPLLILIGAEDDWTPAGRCRRMEVDPGTPHDVTLKIYPGAHHGFDRRPPGPRVYLGHTLERHPEAAIDAEVQLERFLARYLVR